jgi:hypothetical protein
MALSNHSSCLLFGHSLKLDKMPLSCYPNVYKTQMIVNTQLNVYVHVPNVYKTRVIVNTQVNVYVHVVSSKIMTGSLNVYPRKKGSNKFHLTVNLTLVLLNIKGELNKNSKHQVTLTTESNLDKIVY